TIRPFFPGNPCCAVEPATAATATTPATASVGTIATKKRPLLPLMSPPVFLARFDVRERTTAVKCVNNSEIRTFSARKLGDVTDNRRTGVDRDQQMPVARTQRTRGC